MSNVFEGKGVPTLKVGDKVYKLPAPNGSSREGIRQYDFKKVVRDSYRSEGGKQIEIGKKWQFAASLSWIKSDKVTLQILFLAATQQYCEFILNEDRQDIKYNVIVDTPKFKPMAGLRGYYTISVDMIGYEELDAPGYGDLEDLGYGSDWGGAPDKQSP